MPITEDQAFLVARATAVDRHGQVVGPVTGIYYDDHTGAPAWVSVQVAGQHTESTSGQDHDQTAAHRFAPLASASYARGRLHLDVTHQQVRDAPTDGDDDEHLDSEHEVGLYRHYGLSPAGDTDVDPDTASTARSRADDTNATLLPPAES